MSSRVIKDLVDSGVLQEVENRKYQCICNGKTIKKSSVKGHLKSKVHLNRLNNKECSICCELKQSFVKCIQCSQECCVQCNRHVRKCPFCRYAPAPPVRQRSVRQSVRNYERQMNRLVDTMDEAWQEMRRAREEYTRHVDALENALLNSLDIFPEESRYFENAFLMIVSRNF